MAQVLRQLSLILAHTIGVLVAGIMAVTEIRSILLSGPVLAAIGVWLAISAYRTHRRIGFYFGLTSVLSVVAWFLIISGLSWGPDRAHLPVSSFMIAFALASIPASHLSVLEVWPRDPGTRNSFQFSIGTLLSIMFFVALYLGILRGIDVFGRLWLLWSGPTP